MCRVALIVYTLRFDIASINRMKLGFRANLLQHFYILYLQFCISVTIARAVEKKHKARLIAGLANETSKYFQMAG